MSAHAEQLEQLLRQGDPEVRRLAVEQVAQLPGPEAPPLLLLALADEDWRVRKEAATVAPRLASREQLVEALALALAEREDIGLRNAAVEALAALGVDAVAVVVDALRRLDADGRKLAMEVLGNVPDARSVSASIDHLRDEDPNVRAAAAEALGRAGLAGEAERAMAAAALIDVLDATEPMTTLAALDALARLDARVPWPTFEMFANLPLFRRHAIVAASRSREEAALMALAYAAGDASATVAREAMIALASWVLAEPVAPDVLGRARAALARSPRVREHAVSVAADAADARAAGAALLVLALLRDPTMLPLAVEKAGDEEVAGRALAAIELYGPEGVEPLLPLVQRAPERTRAMLLAALARIAEDPDAPEGHRARDAVRRALRDALPDPSTEVLLAAVHGLGDLGDAEDLSRLLTLGAHHDARVAQAVVTAVRSVAARYVDRARALCASLDPADERAIAGCALITATPSVEERQFLERVTRHSDPRARRVAVETLARFGGAAAAELVAFALTDEEREVRMAAVRGLGQLRSAEPLLALAASSEDREVVMAALRALGEAHRGQGFAAARARASSSDAAIAFAAVEAIDRFGQPGEREEALSEALQHPDMEVVKLAITALARDPDAYALARLGISLDHDAWEVRRLVAELLGQSKAPGALALLRARIEREREPQVRDALARALSLAPPSGFDS